MEELIILRDYYIKNGNELKFCNTPRMVCYGSASKSTEEGSYKIEKDDKF